MIHHETWKAVLTALAENGLDPTHPAFASPEVQERAVTVLTDQGMARDMAAAFIAGLTQ